MQTQTLTWCTAPDRLDAVREVASQPVNLSRRKCMNTCCTPLAFRMYCTQLDMYISLLHSTLVPDTRGHVVCSLGFKTERQFWALCFHCRPGWRFTDSIIYQCFCCYQVWQQITTCHVGERSNETRQDNKELNFIYN